MSNPLILRGVERDSREQVRSPLLWEIASALRIPPHQVNVDISFVRNGGDSLAAITVASSCRYKGMVITVAMIMAFDSIRNLIDDFTQRNKSHCLQHENIEVERDLQLASYGSLSSTIHEPQCSRPTEMQLQLVHGSKTAPGRNIVRYYETYRTEDISQVKNAWSVLVATESIFRTRIRPLGDRHCLVEDNRASFIWEETTVDNREILECLLERHDLSTAIIGTTFDVIHLRTGTGIRESTVVWNIHHALIDGYSSVLLLNKHRCILDGRSIKPAPSFVHLAAQLAIFRNAQESTSKEFWATQIAHLHTASGELHLPTPMVPCNPIYVRKHVGLNVTQEFLARHARNTGITVASVFYAAWALLISNYVGSNHVYFGIVLSGRSLPLPDAVCVVGPLINVVPFQLALEPSQTTTNYLTSVFNHSIELDKAQWGIPEQKHRTNFPSLLNIHFETPLLNQNPLHLVRKPHSNMASEIPLNVNINLDGNIELLYHEHKFHERDIERLGVLFVKTVEALLSPDRTIEQCRDILMSEDVEEIRANGNTSSSLIDRSRVPHMNLVSLFDQTAVANPELVAIEKDGMKVAYSELQELATAVARHLTRQIKPGEVVCVHADRSINWVIAIYGILKAGGVYCPLDGMLPSYVRNQNFCQSGARIFLTGSISDKAYQPDGCTLCLSVEEILQGGDGTFRVSGVEIEDNLANCIPSADTGAYLCFTSGSTGLPKGVLCTHKSLVAFHADFEVRLRSRPGWRIAQVMSPAFDGSIHEVFSALGYGSTLVLRSSDDPFQHLSRVEAAVLTPSLAKGLEPDDFPSLRVLNLVGEAVPQDVCDKWASRTTTYNMYGPTEATCGATIKQLQPRKPVTLGKPNPSTRIYVLNSELMFVPLGVIGEIYLAGVQVAQGYINRPDETAARFLPDCLYLEHGQRMYRTGDRGYWDEQGELRFCGRMDRQIKLRGFRIDLDDIETRIRCAIPGCTGVAVACDNDSLVAQLQPDMLEGMEVKKLLSNILPSYAVPRHILVVSEFRRTNAGKIDYMSIKSPFGPRVEMPAPKDDDMLLFNQLARAWREVLGNQDLALSVESNFFELGGHSLLQLKLANKVSSILAYTIPLTAIIQSPTLGDLTERLGKIPIPDILHSRRCSGASTSVSPIEEDWYRKYMLNRGSSSFNVAIAFELSPNIRISKLIDAWNFVLGRHRILRSRFRSATDGSVQKVFSRNPPRVSKRSQIDMEQEMNQPFNLEHDDLIRIMLTPTALLIVASHIICDYTSLNTMLREVSSNYLGTTLKKPVQLDDNIVMGPQPGPVDYEFWQAYLKDCPEPNYCIGKWSQRSSYSGTSHVCQVPTEVFHKLRQFTSSQRVTAHQVSLAAVSLALQHHSDKTDIVLGAPHLGRNGTEAQDIVGLFLEFLAIRIRYPPLEACALAEKKDFLRAVQESSQSALGFAIPWHLLLESFDIRPQLPDPPFFDVVLSYHDSFGAMVMPGIDAKPIYSWTEGAKFKLMVEFVVANDKSLLMRLEYSDECFDEKSIAILGRLIVMALGMVVEGMSYEQIKRHLSATYNKGGTDSGLQGFYGKKLEDF